MTDKDVKREIEENQRRARDEQDVGLEEDVLEQDRQDNTTLLDDLGDAIFGDKDDSRQQDVEYDDNNTSRRSS